MKPLMVENSVQLSRRDGITANVSFLFIRFTGYIAGAQVTRILEKTKVMYRSIFTPPPEDCSRV